MGLFENFLKKDTQKKDSASDLDIDFDSLNCSNFARVFKENYDKIDESNRSADERKIIVDNSVKLSEMWVDKCPNDANAFLAKSVISYLTFNNEDGKKYEESAKRLSPIDNDLHFWFMRRVTSFKTLLGIKEDEEESDLSFKSDEKQDAANIKSTSGSRNFKYLDGLIKSGENNIVLDSDIVLDDLEEVEFSNGIEIKSDNLTIDGNGHEIDAKGKTPIFNILGKGIKLNNIIFRNGYFEVKGGAVLNQFSAETSISDCKFYNNNANLGGGALVNSGEITLDNCLFDGNSAEKAGGAIENDMGSFNASNIMIVNNKSYGGGAINNFAKFNLSDSQIKGNDAEFEAGAIYNNPGGVLRISKTDFSENNAVNGIIFNRGSDVEFIECEFFSHKVDKNLIVNEDSMKFIDCSFYENNASSVIINSENADDLSILNGEFRDNDSIISTIYNLGKACSVSKAVFKNNTSQSKFTDDILNESELDIHSPKFDGIAQTVRNNGSIKVRRLTIEEAEKCIDNHGQIEYFDIPKMGGNQFNFSYLDDLIHDSSVVDLSKSDNLKNVKLRIDENGELVLEDGDRSNVIALTSDITLDNYEVDFYEGGIELDIDNIVIDGNDHSIDANDNSRIFIVSGKNITLRNITFRNGKLINKFDEHTTGGGAIKTINGSSLILENCRFIDNHSDDDGGAILNNGLIQSKNSKFENNYSSYYGGAVYNRNEFTTISDSFINNKSDRAGAIYNTDYLKINDIEVVGNDSKLAQPIYSSNLVKTTNISQDIDELIYNTGNLDQEENSIETFTFLKNKIESSNNVTLKQDIIFNYGADSELKQGMTIDKGGELLIDGNGFSIDGGNESSLFRIKNTKITFKNVIFKGLSSDEGSIIETDSEISFENCKFLNNKSINDSSLIKNHDSLKLVNSLFSDNSSNSKSIIDAGGAAVVLNCQFINNSSNADGGVINSTKGMVIKDSKFEGNSTKNNGGVITNYVGAILEINDSSFVNNSSGVEGGAIMNLGNLDVDGCRFEANEAGNVGGAIHNVNTLNVENSIFVKNSGTYAGAISNMTDVTLRKVVFEENSSKKDGATMNNQGTIKVFESTFKNNHAGNYGGAIANMKTLIVKDSVFESNTAVENAGAINNGTPISVLKVENCDFSNHSANYGGVVSNYGGEVELTNCNFKGNSSNKIGGVLISSNTSEINKCNFISNSAQLGGGIANMGGRIILNDSNFTDNDASNGRDVANGMGSNLEGSNNTFTNNSSKGKDGAIVEGGNVNLRNSTFN